MRDIKGVDLEGKGTGEEGGEIIVRKYSLEKEPIFNKMEKSLLSYAFSTFCYDITCLVPTYLPPFTLDSCLPFLHFLHICSLLILCSCISSFWFVVFTHLLRLLYQIDRIIMALSKEWSGPCGCMENSKYACPDTESLDSSLELNGPSSLNT